MLAAFLVLTKTSNAAVDSPTVADQLDELRDANDLAVILRQLGYTGRIEETTKAKRNLNLDPRKVELGKLLFFDPGTGLHRDNSCSGCHSPTAGMGDTQPIAIGVENNQIVGPDRKGPRNQRRSPTVINTAFYPSLMWNGRFSAPSGDPFDNSKGFLFPLPEGTTTFPPNDPRVTHLLIAQGHIPFTELPEMAGFANTQGTALSFSRFQGISPSAKGGLRIASTSANPAAGPVVTVPPDFNQFADLHGSPLPDEDPATASRNFPIRERVLQELYWMQGFRSRFEAIYPEVKSFKKIQFWMVGDAIATFQISLMFANAPIDGFARGNTAALSRTQKKGAITFFRTAACVTCHAVGGTAPEMFSDFKMHGALIPQIVPKFGKNTGDVAFFDDNGNPSAIGNNDFGRAEFTGIDIIEDRFKYRTAPLRNIGVQKAFFHDGAFNDLEAAIRYHLNALEEGPKYTLQKGGLPDDLRNNPGPGSGKLPPVSSLDPLLRVKRNLSETEIKSLVEFVRNGLLDPRAEPQNLKALIPDQESIPSGRLLPEFQFD